LNVVLNADFFSGFATGLALIVAIGSQNAYVLRQGILRQHLLPLVLFCALSDALLILAGIGGAGVLIRNAASRSRTDCLNVNSSTEWLNLTCMNPERRPG